MTNVSEAFWGVERRGKTFWEGFGERLGDVWEMFARGLGGAKKEKHIWETKYGCNVCNVLDYDM